MSFSVALMLFYFSPVSLFLVCWQWSPKDEQPDLPPWLHPFTENTVSSTITRFLIFSLDLNQVIITCCTCCCCCFFSIKWLFFTVKLDPAKPTLCYSMHVSKEPRDDGYLLVHSPDRDDVDLNEVDNAMMVSSSSVTLKKRALHKEVSIIYCIWNDNQRSTKIIS